MKILIIEDEIPAARQLISILKRKRPTFKILETLDSNESILEWFESSSEIPDLIFSDIELLDGNVFHALISLDLKIPIIFTTAYQQFAVEAFQTSGIAYLLKPIQPESLLKAIEKYDRLTGISPSEIKSLLATLSSNQRQTYRSRFSVRSRSGIYLLQVEEISCIRMVNGVIKAFNQSGKSHFLSGTLSDISEELNPSQFFLINRSDMIHIRYIEKVETYFNDRLAVYVAGQEQPLITSAARTPTFRKWIDA